MNLKIANYYVRISGADFKEFDELFASYITNDKITDFDFEVEFSVKDEIQIPEEKLTAPLRNWQHCQTKDGGVCTMRIDEQGAFLRNDISPDGKKAKVSIANRDKIYGADIWYISFFAIGEAFSYAMLKNKSGVLHSSSIVLNGSAIAFSAQSGTGKSTHTSIWQEVYPDTVIANDDTPVIKFQDGVPYLFGSPFAGTSGVNQNVSAPLKAVVFLHRGTENKIEKLSGARAVSYFVNEIRKPLVPDYLDLCMDFTDKILKSTPVYLLTCTPDERAVETVMNAVQI